MLTVILCVLVVIVVWYVASWFNFLETNQRGLARFFGKVDEQQGVILPGGFIFVPLFPKIDMVRVPTDPIIMDIKADPKDEIRTKDGIICQPDVEIYDTLPFGQIKSMVTVLENNVPFNDPIATAKKFEGAITNAIQWAYAKFDADEVATNKDAICKKIAEKLREAHGVMHRAGVIGDDPDCHDYGKGWVDVNIESTGLPEKVNKAMQAPAIAKQRVKVAQQKVLVAKEEAKVDEARAGDPILLAMDKWIESKRHSNETFAQASERLMATGAYAKHETLVNSQLLARSGNLQVARNEFGSPDGTPLPASLQYLSTGGGAAGVLFKGPGKGNKNPNNSGKGGGNKPKTP